MSALNGSPNVAWISLHLYEAQTILVHYLDRIDTTEDTVQSTPCLDGVNRLNTLEPGVSKGWR